MRKYIKDNRSLLLIKLFLAIFLVLVYAYHAHAKKPEFKPLYQDSTGWFVSKAISGQDVLSAYKFTDDAYRAIKARGVESKCPAQLLYLYENCPAYFYLFFLAVREGTHLRWNDRSLILLTYTHGKDTLTVYSSNLFFATATQPNRLIFTLEPINGVSVPNPGIYSQQEWTDKKTGIDYSLPAIFAKFPFEKMPDKLVDWQPIDVVSFDNVSARR